MPLSVQFFGGDCGAFDEGFEFGPHDGRRNALNCVDLRKSAVGAGDYVLGANGVRVTDDAIGHHAGMLHCDCMVGDHAGN